MTYCLFRESANQMANIISPLEVVFKQLYVAPIDWIEFYTISAIFQPHNGNVDMFL